MYRIVRMCHIVQMVRILVSDALRELLVLAFLVEAKEEEHSLQRNKCLSCYKLKGKKLIVTCVMHLACVAIISTT